MFATVTPSEGSSAPKKAWTIFCAVVPSLPFASSSAASWNISLGSLALVFPALRLSMVSNPLWNIAASCPAFNVVLSPSAQPVPTV